MAIVIEIAFSYQAHNFVDHAACCILFNYLHFGHSTLVQTLLPLLFVCWHELHNFSKSNHYFHYVSHPLQNSSNQDFPDIEFGIERMTSLPNVVELYFLANLYPEENMLILERKKK